MIIIHTHARTRARKYMHMHTHLQLVPFVRSLGTQQKRVTGDFSMLVIYILKYTHQARAHGRKHASMQASKQARTYARTHASTQAHAHTHTHSYTHKYVMYIRMHKYRDPSILTFVSSLFLVVRLCSRLRRHSGDTNHHLKKG